MSRPVPSTQAVEALHGSAEPFGPLDAQATFTSDCSLIRARTNQWTHSEPRASMLSTTYGRPLAALLCRTPTGSPAAILRGWPGAPGPARHAGGRARPGASPSGLRTAGEGPA